MKKLITLFLTLALLSLSIVNVYATAKEVDSIQTKVSEGNTSITEQILKNYIDNKSLYKYRFIFESFGEYKGFEVCYSGYELYHPWDPWARIGNYAFKLNTQIENDEQVLSVYLVKGSDILRLDDAYNNSDISDEDMSEIVNMLIANDEYKKFFYIYNITDVPVGGVGDYTIRYEGITSACDESTEKVEIGQHNFRLGDYNLYIYGYESFTFDLSDNTKGLYVVDKENKVINFTDAYKNSVIGTADEIFNLLNESELSGKGYWEISKAPGEDNTTESTESTTEVTEPTTEPSQPTTSSTEPTTEPSQSTTSSTEPTTEAVQPTTSATEPSESATIPEVKAKKTNKMTVTVKDKKVKAKTLKKAKVTVKAITVKKANGTVSYKKVAKKSSNRLTVNKKTGKITVKKGTKKGVYKIKVKITAKGTKNYKPKTITKTIKIKVQ